MHRIMTGFPVAAQNRVPIRDWDRAPWNRWTFQHVREILPTVEVRRDPHRVWALPEALLDLGALEFSDHQGATTTVAEWLDASFTDGFMVMHRGEVISEVYMNRMRRDTLHLSQSMSKSVTACVAGILVSRGLLDPEQQVTAYLPELSATAWKGATLRHLLDMTSGVRYVEDYTAVDSDIALTDVASGWKPDVNNLGAPECIWDQVLTLTESVRPHGERFEYRSIETDVLAHCLERVTQTSLAELVSRELWRPLGCENHACFTVDRAGYALACGGLNACLRDYTRFGQMLARRGEADGRRVVPAEWIDDITNVRPPAAGEPFSEATPQGGYRNQFWVERAGHAAFMARGVFGQLIYVDPDAGLVVTKLSSWPEFISAPRLITTLNAIHRIRERLDGR